VHRFLPFRNIERARKSRRKAQPFRDPKARTRMRQIAADYDRKARQADAVEPVRIGNK